MSQYPATLDIMDAYEKLMTTWCDMWNDDAGLAHDLMTDDCRQCGLNTDALDDVVGPDRQQDFVRRYQVERGNHFTPRTLVAGGEHLAFLWDVRDRAGRIRNGIDVDVLRDGRVADNWTVVADRHSPLWPESPGGRPSTRDELRHLADRWSAVWNGDAHSATGLVTDAFRIWFGSSTGTDGSGCEPGDRARRPWALRTPGMTYRTHREPVVDAERQSLACLWTVSDPGHGHGHVGRIDLLTVRDGRLDRCWSITGSRAFRY